ncbi:MAG: flap endonuclease-1 [Candidatus Helarchaeota archaeon]
MGVKIKPILESVTDKKLIKEIAFSDLSGQIIAVDAANTIYQFLTVIQSGGVPLKDSRGRITSHLSGIFYRNIRLIEMEIKPIYVFDGKPPELKSKTVQKRRERSKEARIKWQKALSEGDLEAARKYGQAARRITTEIIKDSKRLLKAMGIPYVQAVTEGEAQAAYMVGKNDVTAVASQDFDALLFGAPKLVRNLSLVGRRRSAGRNQYVEVVPELIESEEVFETLKLTREQLIDIAILIGTDFNEGIKGVGAKTALKLIRKYGNLKTILQKENFEFSRTEDELEQIRNFFLHPEVTDEYEVHFHRPNVELIKKILVDEHDFSLERIEKSLKRLEKMYYKLKTQKSLDRWF